MQKVLLLITAGISLGLPLKGAHWHLTHSSSPPTQTSTQQQQARRIGGQALTLPEAAAIGLDNGHVRAVKTQVKSGQIRPAMLVWSVGTNEPDGPSQMVETIIPAMFGHQRTWRVTHYAQDPTGTKTNDYDLYDIDRETLAPLRSIMNNENLYLELIFANKEVTLRRITSQGSTSEKIPLSAPVRPEGPGSSVFVAGLPLAVGYNTRYQMVDRWSSEGSSRLKTMTLSVLSRSIVTTALGRQDTYEVLIRPDDGSFQIKERVRAKVPHFPITVEYIRKGSTLISEVTTMAIK